MTFSRIRFRRYGVPVWARSDKNWDTTQYGESGEQPNWGYAVPWMYQTLASPLSDNRMPRKPRPHGRLDESLGYWGSLLHLLLYGFGWTRPHAGLDWYLWQHDSSMRGEDEWDVRLQLLDRVWMADGQLEYFAEWLHRYGSILPAAQQMLSLAGSEPSPGDTFRNFADDYEPWLNPDVEGIALPLSASWDALHLSLHSSGPLEPGHHRVAVSPDGDAAVLLSDTGFGWYRALIEWGQQADRLGSNAAEVDVVVKPMGWLGTFARSPSTGLWHRGKSEQIHHFGN